MGNFEPPCSRLSYAVIRMARIARIERFVLPYTSLSYRSDRRSRIGRNRGTHSLEWVPYRRSVRPYNDGLTVN